MKTKRIVGWSALALLLLLMAAAALYAHMMTPKLELGVGYAARVACGCRYIEGRPLESCYKDFEPGMEVIRLVDDPKTKTVTASVPLIASRKVTFDPLLGCQPEPYKQ
jgi:hypothetical protein